MMKQSKQILYEADIILDGIKNHEITNCSILNKYIIKQNPEINKRRFNYFIQLVINYVFQSQKITNNANDDLDLMKINKESIIEILSILRFESIDENFFYHYIFKKESQNNLIKEEKIIKLIKIFDLYSIEFILSIPSFSFVQSNYLSNCEFVNFFKESISASITNDYTSIYQQIFHYLEEINEGELTQDQFLSFLNKIYTINENFINEKMNIQSFTNVIQRIIQFILLPSGSNESHEYLSSDEFVKIFGLSCKFINMTIKNEFFDIAYKRKDFYFSGKVLNRYISDILDDMSVIYTKLNKEKIIKQVNQLEISYFELHSIVSEEIDLSDLS